VGRRLLSSAVAVATLVVSGALVPGVVASAAPAADPDVEQMEEYSPGMFAREAAQLPTELIEALDRDVDVTGAEYLAEAAAATQAVIVVESLGDAGIEVLGSRMEGTQLVVNVGDDAAAAVVEEAGATPEFGEPEPFVLDQPIHTTADLWDGQGYYWSDDPFDESGYVCTTGFQGFNDSTGDPEFITAGHCLEGAESIVGPVSALVMTAPNTVTTFFDIGAPLVSTRKWGTGAGDVNYDVSRIAVTSPNVTPQPGVQTWGFGAGGPTSTPRTYVTGQSAAIDGATLCASGMRTGWRCGPILEVDYDADNFVDDENNPIPGLHVNSIVAQVCALPGDSGGSAIVGTNAVGTTSWSTDENGVCDSGDVAGFFPMLSLDGTKATVATAYTDWELEVLPPAPAITTAGGAINPTTLTGTVPASGRSASNSVVVTFDDGTTLADSSVTSGAWSVSTAGVAAGLHTFTAKTQYGAYSFGPAVSGYFSKGVTVDRLSGESRYDTAVAIATAAYPDPVDTVFITTGANYPDALSAGPAAVHLDAPVLLAPPTGLTTAVRDALIGFDPNRVFVVGASGAVSSAVYAQIEDAVPDAVVDRISGDDRFGTSLAVTRAAFLTEDSEVGGSSVAYVANGLNFPDALSAGGASATADAPVILVNGTGSSVSAAFADLLDDLDVTHVRIVGGTGAVSASVASSIQSLGVNVVRLSGVDRFATATAVNQVFSTSTDALLATGFNFPDALAGSALAGARGAPLYITQANCILPVIYADLVRIDATKVTLLGGTGALGTPVAQLKRC
jgi:putative cell wall-binding protein